METVGHYGIMKMVKRAVVHKIFGPAVQRIVVSRPALAQTDKTLTGFHLDNRLGCAHPKYLLFQRNIDGPHPQAADLQSRLCQTSGTSRLIYWCRKLRPLTPKAQVMGDWILSRGQKDLRGVKRPCDCDRLTPPDRQAEKRYSIVENASSPNP